MWSIGREPELDRVQIDAQIPLTSKLPQKMLISTKTAIFLVALALCCSALELDPQKEHCVCSNDSNSTSQFCKECKTLEDYLSSPSSLDNTLLKFTPGTHDLTRPWNLTGIRGLTLASIKENGAATVECTTENAGLRFTNASLLTIQDISVFRCGMDATINQRKVKSALIFLGGRDLTLQSLNLTNSRVAGVSLHNVQGSVVLNTSLFTSANFSGKYNYYTMGNAIVYDRAGNTTVQVLQTTFEKNSYREDANNVSDKRLSAGLSIILNTHRVNITLSRVTLRRNGGRGGGNMAIIVFKATEIAGSSTVTIQDSVFEGGHGKLGGGAFIALANPTRQESKQCANTSGNSLPLLAIRNSHFTNNSVRYVGGALYIKARETHCPTANPAYIVMDGCVFSGNHIVGDRGNGGLALHYTTIATGGLEGNSKPQWKFNLSRCHFSNHGGTQKLGNAVVLVKTSNYFSMADVNITDNAGTGLFAVTSNILISGKVMIARNRALSGGGLLICAGAFVYLTQHSDLQIIGNSANQTGGGINVELECIVNVPKCFFQFVPGFSLGNHTTAKVTIKDNTATYAGDNVYGGSVLHCYLIDQSKDLVNFTSIFAVPRNNPNTPSSISSAPEKVCRYNHTTKNKTCGDGGEIEVYAGEKFSIDVIVLGQYNGLVPGTVHANLEKDYPGKIRQYLDKRYALQKVDKKEPQSLFFRVYSKDEDVSVKLHLTVDEYGANPNSKILKITIRLKNCPLGYTLDQKSTQSSCSCDEVRKITHKIDKTLTCYKSEGAYIQYSPPLWIGRVNFNFNSSYPQTLAVAKSCPRDYCYLKEKLKLYLTNLTVDSSTQCYFRRSGVLCGSCSENYSLILGSSECRANCTNYHLFLIIVFAVAGVLLVFVITFLNMTVSAGTINGLVFYANIVQIHAAFMFEENHSFVASFLRIFLAWLNLDFGFKTCFFRGMDGLSKALLQFVFPVYVWMLAGAIIFLCRYYTIMKVFGKNSVQVLATLVFLSYSKVIRAAMGALHFTTIDYLPGKEHLTVFHWSLDGHLQYLHDGHLLVFVVGLTFALTSLPFLAILLCIKHIGRFSNWPLCSWIHRLKPFFDSYTGPFTDRGRFWVGLLLLARLLVLGAYSFNRANSDLLIMAVTVLVCFLLLFVAVFLPKGIYKKHTLNTLEYFFLVNLGLLFLVAICTVHYNDVTTRKYAVNISTGLSLVVFVSVLVYHLEAKLTCLRSLKRYVLQRFRRGRYSAMESPPYDYHRLDSETDPLLR